MHRFKDFAKDDNKPIEGEKVRLEDYINKEIIISEYKIRDSNFKEKYDKYATVQFYEERNKDKRIFFSGSTVLINMLEKYKDKIPFITTIRKIGKYYSFT